jgi:MFS family permease
MASALTAYLLFLSTLVNQMGRVMVPAIKTSVIADAEMGAEFREKVGVLLSGVSVVCLGGKLLGAAVTDRLGGWVMLIVVFAVWIVSTLGSIFAPTVDAFGHAWLLNSFAYTITWGSVVQIIGAEYDAAGKAENLAFCASASRFGASIGNVVYGQLLTAGLSWRQVQMPMVPLQTLLLLLCAYKCYTAAAPAPAAAAAKSDAKQPADEPANMSVGAALLSLDFWLMVRGVGGSNSSRATQHQPHSTNAPASQQPS